MPAECRSARHPCAGRHASSGPLTVVTRTSYWRVDLTGGCHASSAPPPTSTPSPATTSRRTTSGRSCIFDPAGAALPATAQLRGRAAGPEHRAARRRPPVPAVRHRRPGPTASCSPASDRIAHVLVDDLGVVPGNRVLLRGPEQPVAGRVLVRPCCKAGAVVVTTMPRCARGELRTIARHRARSTSRCATTGSSTTCAAANLAPGCASVDGGGAGGLTATPSTAKARTFTAVDTAADDVALLAFTSGTTGRPKATMHFHRDVLAIADTFSPHVLRPAAGRRVHRHTAAGLHVRARRPRGLPDAGRRRDAAAGTGDADAAAARASPSTGSRCCSPRRPRTGRCWRPAGRTADCPRCAAACRRARTCPPPPGGRFHDAPACGSSTASARPRCCTSSSPPPTATSGPGSTGRAVPGLQARPWSTPTGDAGADGELGLLAVRGPTGCRYLADAAAGGVRAATAGTSPATPTSATPTATSGTWPAATT